MYSGNQSRMCRHFFRHFFRHYLTLNWTIFHKGLFGSWEVVFDNRLDNRRQTVIVEFLFNQTSWFHACKYHATLPGIINFTVAALPPLVLLGPCDSPPSALQCASGNVSCLEIWGAKNIYPTPAILISRSWKLKWRG